ncbi:DNA-binding transcriptional MerR regulator [Pseudarthrobacter oxydans]|uniref:DNA-binding transcriptional MerR regulator n=1 Tax=Pseudarthrobacter oxydans TaxID=1671 RepID=A0AAW8NI58_PSEOX|nr:MerR family transcriptional regulator [Pseudarthrobacter oxydans]MDR7165698.1 DNA-binding transcriptional MerR regulator [Pseudarthrobacter oxydans]
MRISELAAASGPPATTLRYYESVGLLTANRGTNGYRDYDDDALRQLSFIEAAKQLDMSLPEIVELRAVIQGESCTQVREVLHPRLRQRLLEVDKRLANLHLLRARLDAAVTRVGACPDSRRSCRSECALLGTQQDTCTALATSPETIDNKGTR